MKSIRIFTVVIVLLILLGLYFGSPFVAVWNLKQAVAKGDTIAVSTYVDFPMLRENLKSGIRARLSKEAQDPEVSGSQKFRHALFSLLTGPAVDNVTTPDQLIVILRTGRPIGVNDDITDNNMRTGHMSFDSLSRFVVELDSPDASVGDTPSELVFERRGLMGWKLIGMRY